MPITCQETPDSRDVSREATGESDSIKLRYIIRGTADDEAAYNALGSTAPSSFRDLPLLNLDVKPSFVNEDDEDSCIWEGIASYGVRPETGESSYSFDTGGGSQHVTQSKQTIGKYAPSGKTAPDFKGAIGVTESGVEGVDIHVPVFSWSETHYIAPELVTDEYKQTLAGLTGTVNDDAFVGCAAGEVLFQGASGSRRGDEDWAITFRFAASKNKTDIAVGDITVPAKKGWEYLWVLYEDDDDATAKAFVKKPRAAYVEKVYEDGDFSELVPTAP